MVAIYLLLEDNTATALSSDSLPIDAPNLDDWPKKREIIIWGSGFLIWADITSLTKGTLTGIGLKDPANAPRFTVFPNAPNPVAPT